MRKAKALFTKNAEQIQVEGYEFVGHGTQGAIFLNKEVDQYVVVQAIAKKEGFDAWEDIDAQAEKDRKAEEKAKAKAEKVAKAKAKKEEEGE